MRKYDEDFKKQAVNKYLNEHSVASIAGEIGRSVGSKVSQRMTAQFVNDVFLQARRRGLIGKNAIIHTDQGSQYAAVEYRRLLDISGLRQSMSRKGNCYDNGASREFLFQI